MIGIIRRNYGGAEAISHSRPYGIYLYIFENGAIAELNAEISSNRCLEIVPFPSISFTDGKATADFRQSNKI